jgi:hypothetical protein
MILSISSQMVVHSHGYHMKGVMNRGSDPSSHYSYVPIMPILLKLFCTLQLHIQYSAQHIMLYKH